MLLKKVVRDCLQILLLIDNEFNRVIELLSPLMQISNLRLMSKLQKAIIIVIVIIIAIIIAIINQ